MLAAASAGSSEREAMSDTQLTPPDIADFVVRMILDAEAQCDRLSSASAALTYQKARIRALAGARAILESMCERRRGRNIDRLEAGISAIAAIRATAVAEDDYVSIRVTRSDYSRLRDCMGDFIEYEVLWEKDQSSTGSRRGSWK